FVVLDTLISDSSEQQFTRWDRFRIWFYTNILFRTDLHDYPPIEAANLIQGPSLRDMWREYQESEYYNVEMGSSSNSQLPIPDCPTSEAIPDNSQQLCLPQTVDDIVRPLDPSTSET
ncbi:28523_t:CDS:1, partial [Gigaspora margarita]